MTDTTVLRMFALGLTAVGIAACGVYQQSKGHDGSGWGVVAFCLVVATCSQH